jgi:hypothetical protein
MPLQNRQKLFRIIFRIFGLLYFLVNALFFAAIMVLSYNTWITRHLFGDVILGIFPAVGILAGYFIFRELYGWFQKTIIAVSFLITAGALAVMFLMIPKIEEIKAKAHVSSSEMAKDVRHDSNKEGR